MFVAEGIGTAGMGASAAPNLMVETITVARAARLRKTGAAFTGKANG
jgi:hypothetical protein